MKVQINLKSCKIHKFVNTLKKLVGQSKKKEGKLKNYFEIKTQHTKSYGMQQNSAKRKIHDIQCVHLKKKSQINNIIAL